MLKKNRVEVHIPIDIIAADKFSNDSNTQIVNANEIPQGWMGLDIGPKSIQTINAILLKSKTILWNGPVGVFELEKFENGTKQLGQTIAQITEKGAYSLVGGGDSVAAVKKFNLTTKMSYVSTGGGALLEMLEGKTLPGIKAILDEEIKENS